MTTTQSNSDTSTNAKFNKISTKDMEYVAVQDIKYTMQNNSPYHSKVKIFPLEHGMGQTLGNSLRRILMKYIPSSTVIAYKINNMPSEYLAVPGCVEDMVEVNQNLKGLKFRHSEKYSTIDLEIKGPCTVDGLYIANEIKKLGLKDVEVTNYDQHIMTLTTDDVLKLSIISAHGCGYFASDEPNYWSEDIKQLMLKSEGYKPIDSMFSPITKCSYLVQDHYLPNGKLCDMLEIDLATNGLITPKDAVAQSLSFLAEQSMKINAIQNVEMHNSDQSTMDIKFNPILLAHVEDIDFESTRAENGFKSLKIKHLGDLVTTAESKLLQTPSMGARTVDLIKTKLKELNLEFGMYIADWPIQNVTELRQKHLPEIMRSIMELRHSNSTKK